MAKEKAPVAYNGSSSTFFARESKFVYRWLLFSNIEIKMNGVGGKAGNSPLLLESGRPTSTFGVLSFVGPFLFLSLFFPEKNM